MSHDDEHTRDVDGYEPEDDGIEEFEPADFTVEKVGAEDFGELEASAGEEEDKGESEAVDETEDFLAEEGIEEFDEEAVAGEEAEREGEEEAVVAEDQEEEVLAELEVFVVEEEIVEEDNAAEVPVFMEDQAADGEDEVAADSSGPQEEATDDGFSLTGALARDIEAVIFISPEPLSLDTLAEITEAEGEELSHAIEAVREKFSDPDGGIVFAEVAGGYTFRTSDRALGAVERFCRRPVDYSLSPAAMETLAIIAYLQPVSRPDIARIRGVGADTVVANLLDKGLVMEAGRAEQTGAICYRTTEAFEKLFGLSDITSLPAIEGFEATPGDVEELREKLYLAAEKRA